MFIFESTYLYDEFVDLETSLISLLYSLLYDSSPSRNYRNLFTYLITQCYDRVDKFI